MRKRRWENTLFYSEIHIKNSDECLQDNLVLAEDEPFLGYAFCHHGENLQELGQVRSL